MYHGTSLRAFETQKLAYCPTAVSNVKWLFPSRVCCREMSCDTQVHKNINDLVWSVDSVHQSEKRIFS